MAEHSNDLPTSAIFTVSADGLTFLFVERYWSIRDAVAKAVEGTSLTREDVKIDTGAWANLIDGELVDRDGYWPGRFNVIRVRLSDD